MSSRDRGWPSRKEWAVAGGVWSWAPPQKDEVVNTWVTWALPSVARTACRQQLHLSEAPPVLRCQLSSAMSVVDGLGPGACCHPEVLYNSAASILKDEVRSGRQSGHALGVQSTWGLGGVARRGWPLAA